MSPSNNVSKKSFNWEILDLLQHVECREAILDAEVRQIYALRYAAYLQEGAAASGSPEFFTDSFDRTENGRTFGLYIDGQLASTIRVHVATPAAPICPAMSAFSDCLRPMLDSGVTLVDPTRFVLDANFARRYRKLPYATIRVAWMACEHAAATVLLATVRPEHQAFYRGLFGHRIVCDPRPYPSLSKPVSLMALDICSERDRILRRYPFLRSTESERSAIFRSAFGMGMTNAPRFREASDSMIPVDARLRAGRSLRHSQCPAVA